jgi:hypothetical protein
MEYVIQYLTSTGNLYIYRTYDTNDAICMSEALMHLGFEHRVDSRDYCAVHLSYAWSNRATPTDIR